MPYTEEHKSRSRERILESAVSLFCSRGYENVSIDDLMSNAQLTRGAFYAHFKSKSDVYMHAISAAAKSAGIFCDVPDHLQKEKLLAFYINRYLSLDHVNQAFSPCPMAFLVTDVAINEPKVKKTYTLVYEGFLNLIKHNLPDHFSEKKRESVSLELSALMIGSVAVSRALSNPETQLRLLEENRSTALKLINATE